MTRIKQPSTWAGIGLICAGIAQAIASKGADAAAWGQILSGLGAVLINEKGATK